MTINFDACDIRIPRGEDLVALYHMLMDVFPPDRPIIEEHLRSGDPNRSLTHYTLFRGSEVVGSAGLMPMRIWLNGRKLPVVGIASVATPERFRGQGVARHLLEHCLSIVEREELPSVLYTDLPAVYARLGFVQIKQTLSATSAAALVDATAKCRDCRLHDTISPEMLREMTGLQAGAYPKFDATIDRDEPYWSFYGSLINLYPKCRVLLDETDGRLRGYARCEQEKNRLLVSELCYDGDCPSVVETLLAAAARLAKSCNSDILTLALPNKHPAWSILQEKGLAIEPEPPGASCEIFMVRPAKDKPLGRLAELQWSLADKF